MATTTQTEINPVPRTRTSMKSRATSYEVVAILPGSSSSIRLGFTAQISKLSILAVARQPRNLDKILPHVSEYSPSSYSRSKGWNIGGVVIRLSGRTERDCANEEGRM